MTQFVVDSTRFNSNGVGNILDIVLCNDPLAVISNSSKDPFSTSDHSVIDFTLFVPTVCDMRTRNDDFVINNSTSLDLFGPIQLPVYKLVHGQLFCNV